MKNKSFFGVLSYVSGAFLLFAAAFLYLPSSGVIRALALVLVLSAFAKMLIRNNKYFYGLSFVLCFILYCTMSGFNTDKSLLYSAFFTLMCFFGALIYGFFKKKNAVKALLTAAVGVVIYTLVCGNIFSAVYHRNSNMDYIKKNYPEMKVSQYTYFSLPDFAYRTNVSFTYESLAVGESIDVFLCRKGQDFTDGIRDLFEESILNNSQKMFASFLATCADNTDVLLSDIDFEYGEVIDSSLSFTEYLPRVDYAAAVYAVEMDKGYFEGICSDVAKKAKQAAVPFSSVTIVGADTKEVKYICTIDNLSGADVEIKSFQKDSLKRFGLKATDVLAYWLGE